MKYLVLVMMAVFTDCGITVHSDPVKVNPIEVNHTVTVNAAQLETFYKSYCESKFTVQSEIDQCMTDSLTNFWLAVQQATPPGQVQTTGPTGTAGGITQ